MSDFEVIIRLFKAYDVDGSGSISAAELSSMFILHTDEEVEEMMAATDADGDGQVSLDELWRLKHDQEPGR